MWAAIRRSINSNLAVPLNTLIGTLQAGVSRLELDAAFTRITVGTINTNANTAAANTNTLTQRLTAARATNLDNLTALAGANGVRSNITVQRGLVNLQPNSVTGINISNAPLSRSFVNLNWQAGSTSSFNGRLVSATSLQIASTGVAITQQIPWEVITFN